MNWYLPRYEVVKKKETTVYRYNDEQIRFKNTHTHTHTNRQQCRQRKTQSIKGRCLME